MTHEPDESLEPQQLRLFVAIPLPEAIRAQVAGLLANLQKGAQFTPCRPSWSHPETMHLTLAFLGKMPLGQVQALGAAMQETASHFSPLKIEIKQLGVFPNWKYPRVLWAGVRERTHQIEALQAHLAARLAPLGYRPEQREFHPHLTLARFKSLKGASAFEKVVQGHGQFRFGPFEADQLVLYRSQLDPQGAQHTPLAHAQLSAQPAGE